MTLRIQKAAVLGAGVMGAQIAAHLAAAGIRTHLLDLSTDKEPEDPKLRKVIGKNYRSTPAIMAIENLKHLKPSPLCSASILPNIIPGNFDDDMSVLSEVDWVIEAVVERLDIKKSMMKRIAEHTRPDTPVTSNTSGLLMSKMVEDMDESFHQRFFGTHFFNPPRYMKLVEIIPHPKSNPELINDMANWIEKRLGKGIVYANDTINFIANRIGVFNIQASLHHMAKLDLNIETVDALTGKLMGRPSSATFRTMDVVGIDTFVHVAQNVYDYAPEDPYRDWFLAPEWIKALLEKGHLGQKTASVGAYKKAKDKQGNRVILAYRPSSDSYEEQKPELYPWLADAKKIADPLERLKVIIEQDDSGSQFIWRTLRDTLAYSALLLNEIANGKPIELDNAIKWGFNWEWGPFEIWQALGYEKIRNRMLSEGVKLPDWCTDKVEFYNPCPNSLEWHMKGCTAQFNAVASKTESIPESKHQYHLPKFQNNDDPRVVLSNKYASLVDLGDDVAALVFHSKMNSINTDMIELTMQAVDKVSKNFAGMVVGNEAAAFSAGADLRQILGGIKENKFEDIDNLLRGFQGSLQALKYAPFPSVSCPTGLTLGGGCEVSLHTSTQLLTNDTFAGLVEVGVGLLPAGGGTKELAVRAYEAVDCSERGDPMPFLQRAFMLIGMGRTSTSGREAIEMGLYPKDASYTLARDFQIDAAKHQVLDMANRGYVAPIPRKYKVVGDPGIHTFNLMLHNMVEGRQISAHDALIGRKIATVLCGGDIDANQLVGEEHFLALERRLFIELCHEEKTQARIEHMLKTGKPLRN